MKTYKPLKIKISMQGAPLVNQGWIHAKGAGVIAAYVDLKSKYCDVAGTSYTSDGDLCGVMLEATEESLYLHKTKGQSDYTEILFPEYPNWEVHSASVGRYTLAVCLTKK